MRLLSIHTKVKNIQGTYLPTRSRAPRKRKFHNLTRDRHPTKIFNPLSCQRDFFPNGCLGNWWRSWYIPRLSVQPKLSKPQNFIACPSVWLATYPWSQQKHARRRSQTLSIDLGVFSRHARDITETIVDKDL